MGRTGPDGQNIPGQKDVLMNEERVFCERQYLYILRQNIMITSFYKQH